MLIQNERGALWNRRECFADFFFANNFRWILFSQSSSKFIQKEKNKIYYHCKIVVDVYLLPFYSQAFLTQAFQSDTFRQY